MRTRQYLEKYLFEDHAVRKLADSLSQGTLVLFLGAGTTMGAGLPDWETLITGMHDRAEVDSRLPAKPTADQLQAAADALRRDHFAGDEVGFRQLVKHALYGDISLSEEILKDATMIALGALLTGSRRGSVHRIITLNFDCVLEWYLTLHGMVPKVVSKLPTLEGNEDVRIYHPHGFLPHTDLPGKHKSSDFLVLDLKEVDLRLGTPGEPWMELIRHVMSSGICLFVGMSAKTFADRAISPPLSAAAASVHDDRPIGFWIIGRGTQDEREQREQHETPEQREQREQGEQHQTSAMLEKGIVPVFLPDYDCVPDFLLRICRQAAVAERPGPRTIRSPRTRRAQGQSHAER